MHGHTVLEEWNSWNVLRYDDSIFTVIRDPIARTMSEVNYALTRIFADESPTAHDTRWLRDRFDVSDLSVRTSPAAVKELALRCLYDAEVVPPNLICRTLGLGSCDSAVEQSLIHDLEITETSRYDEWCRKRWDRQHTTSRNTSIPFVSLRDLEAKDEEYIVATCEEDLKFYRIVTARLLQTGGVSIRGEDLAVAGTVAKLRTSGSVASPEPSAPSRPRPEGEQKEGIRNALDGHGATALRVVAQGPQAAPFFTAEQSAEEASPIFEIVFGEAGNSDGYTISGWSRNEPGFTWADAPESGLRFPRPDVSAAHRLRLLGRPFLWNERLPTQRIGLWVNDVEIGWATVSAEPVVIDCELPWSVLDKAPEVRLTWFFPDALRPSEVKGGDEDRLLAFRFEKIQLFRGHNLASEDAQSHNAAPSEMAEDLGRAPHGKTALQAAPAPEQEEPPLSDRELMMRFESLGENCEFGLVQRRCGAEPLGLFRFASAPLPKLLAGLEARFEGFGDPDNLEVQLSPNGREYMVYDKKFQLLYHAWVLAEEMTAEEIHKREMRRLPLLVRKLLEDLSQAEKIFVFHGMEPLAEDMARRLLAVLRDYGPNTLLWIEVADAEHPPGTVDWAGEGLLKAYIDRFAPGENAHDLSLDCWVAICRQAHRAMADRARDRPDTVTLRQAQFAGQ